MKTLAAIYRLRQSDIDIDATRFEFACAVIGLIMLVYFAIGQFRLLLKDSPMVGDASFPAIVFALGLAAIAIQERGSAWGTGSLLIAGWGLSRVALAWFAASMSDRHLITFLARSMMLVGLSLWSMELFRLLRSKVRISDRQSELPTSG